jgi:undecaprenyl-diphosphatase
LFFGLSSALPTAASTGLNDSQKNALTIEQAMVLGVVEGITEYLPVSSTGHLLIAERIMGVGGNPSLSTEKNAQIREATDAYTVCIQIGAIVAVIGIFFRRIKQMLLGLIGKDNEGRHLLMNVVAGFIPAAVIGVLFNKMIKTYLFGPWPVIVAWFVGGLVILAVSNKTQGKEDLMRQGKTLAELSWKMALVIGLAQCIAMWPGVSRSLVTIVGGLLLGLSLPAAVEFSFLLGLITLSAATSFDFFTHGQVMLQTFDVLSLTIGIAVAFGSAVLSVKWMVAYLTRHGLAIFGYYRVALSLVVGTMLINGLL